MRDSFKRRPGLTMPYLPKRQCSCGAIVSGPCPDCKSKRNRRYNQQRDPATTRWRSSARFLRNRSAFLSRHPLCVECKHQGRTEAATVLDHVIPHKGNYNLFWNQSNWQGLCDRHHNIKTASEGAFGRSRKNVE